MNITLELQKLDDLIVKHTAPPVTSILRNQLHPLREQMEAYIESKSGSEKRALDSEARCLELAAQHTKLQQAQLARDDEMAAKNRHKVGVTLKNGKTVYYDGNTYAFLPKDSAPVMIEFRMVDKANHFRVVGHAKYEDVSELHKPAA